MYISKLQRKRKFFGFPYARRHLIEKIALSSILQPGKHVYFIDTDLNALNVKTIPYFELYNVIIAINCIFVAVHLIMQPQ